MNAQERDAAYLWDMHAAATNIQEFIRGINYDRFTNDKIIRYAVERQLEIIGKRQSGFLLNFKKRTRKYPGRKWSPYGISWRMNMERSGLTESGRSV